MKRAPFLSLPELLAGVALAWALVALHGCTFARVRYLNGAEKAALLVCRPVVNTLECQEYHAANRADGVQLVPLNYEDRTEM